jgi:hypothetical protein
VTFSFGLGTRICYLEAHSGAERWLWLPSPRWNGGRFGHHECVDVSVNWLNCWVSFTAHVPTSRPR